MIEKINIKNFTVFEDLNIEFSPRINIIIGENGTGKSHLLKLIHSFYNSETIETLDLGASITNNLIKLFLPLDNNLWKLKTTNSEGATEISADFSKGAANVSYNFNVNSKTVNLSSNAKTDIGKSSVFIPPKEVLSFMKGFNSLYEKYGLSFDKSYNDICLLLDLPDMRIEKLQEKAKWAIDEIEDICQGKFIFYGGGKITFQTKFSEYAVNTIAEGFRKIGMLARLLETGAISPGESGPLLWDEPEANMNPKLLKNLVSILFELSRNGQQIILSTHDYVLLKWFDSLFDIKKEDHIMYHVLYHDVETNKVKFKSTDNYLDISPNSIMDAFDDLTDFDISKTMGELGK